MGLLMWEKPKRARTKTEWEEYAGFEDGPTGGYVPNMSVADQRRWKATLSGTKLGFPQIEIRRTTQQGSQMLIVVNLGGGYNYKSYRAVNESYVGWTPQQFRATYRHAAGYSDAEIERRLFPTRGINVHIALNGPAQMSFEELADMNAAIEEAKQFLERVREAEGAVEAE